MVHFLETLNQLLWGIPILLLLGFTHLYFTIRLKFPQRFTFHAIRLSGSPEKSSDQRNLSGFATLATTLAATLGTGNIIGVSTAIAIGGPGALFWCWLTGIFGMATCYAECYLSILYRKKNQDGILSGGPMAVLELGLHSKTLGKIYALCTLFAAFGIGCTTQAAAITESVSTFTAISPHLIGIMAASAAGAVILGGISSISRFCTRIVPILGIFYIGCCLVLLYLNRSFIGSSTVLVMDSAFHTKAAAGGFIGSTMMSAARYGIARGLFTNEAGIGTAAIAAASSSENNPRRQALISMTAVFWDTVIMCAVTGLVIITNIQKNPSSITGCSTSSLTTAAFTFLPIPIGGENLLSVSLVAFALTTLIGWCSYGERASEYLFGKGSLNSYRLCYIVMIYLGAVLPMNLIWNITDFINAVMIIPNCIALFALRKQIQPP